MTLIEELLSLRSKAHEDNFRFNLDQNLWASHYMTNNEIGEWRLVQVRKNDVLQGYAVLDYSLTERSKALVVREMCADTRETFRQLIERVIEEGVKENADFIAWRQCQEPFNDILQEKGFITLMESIIMVALLNPRELLKPLSVRIDDGSVARLNIKGFESVFLRIGKGKFSVIESCREGFKISTDGLTFIKLFFGKSSFFKEWLTRKIKVSILRYRTAKRLFETVKNEHWYIPSGDWC